MLKRIRENLSTLPVTRYQLLGFFSLFVIFILNARHYAYPDEFDNITGGYFIDHGRLPYTGFFTHHGPFAYFFAALITLFTGASFVRFRFALAVVYLLLFIAFYFYIRYRFEYLATKTVAFMYAFLAVMATYVWAHMLLADALVGYFLIPAYIMMFWILFRNQALRRIDVILISLLTAFLFLTSPTYLYAVVIMYGTLILWYFIKRQHKIIAKETFVFFGILAAPWVVFLLYLLLTGSIKDYYYQSIYFNRMYYVTMPDGGQCVILSVSRLSLCRVSLNIIKRSSPRLRI